MENTASENIAITLQQLVKETRELQEDNRRLHEELKKQQDEHREVEKPTSEVDSRHRRKRWTALKGYQVTNDYRPVIQHWLGLCLWNDLKQSYNFDC